MRIFRPIGAWLADHPWTISVLAMSLAVLIPLGLSQRADAQARARDRDQAIEVIVGREVANCEQANETRDLIRTIGVQSDVATATASSEALILVVQQVSENPPDPAIFQLLRDTTRQQATERSTAIFNQLTERDCEAEGTSAREEAERALG